MLKVKYKNYIYLNSIKIYLYTIIVTQRALFFKSIYNILYIIIFFVTFY